MTPRSHQGLLFGIIVLICLSLTCHITNFFSPLTNTGKCNQCKHNQCKCKQCKCKQTRLDTFFNTGESSSVFRPYDETTQEMSQMNVIQHMNINGCKDSPCSAIQETAHARIPCSVYQQCGGSGQNGVGQLELSYQYSDEDLKVLMLSTYHQLGKEISRRRV